MNKFAKIILLLVAALLLGGCVADQRDRRLVKGMDKAQPPYDSGAIYKTGFNDRPLFEDRRARNVGDMLVMTVPESALPPKSKAEPQKNADGTESEDPERNSRLKMTEEGDIIGFLTSDALVGTIPVTVMKVLDNGHLLVAGGKRVQEADEDRYVRISGEVDPMFIKDGNSIQSTQLTDVQIQVDELRIYADGTATRFSEGRSTFGNFFHSMRR